MCTRLHALGFPCEWTRENAEIIGRLAVSQSRRVACRDGDYRVWRTGAGAELWFHYPAPRDERGQRFPANSSDIGALEGITPFHRGQSSVKVRIGRILMLDRKNPLEGACLAWLPASSKKGREQAFVMELVPFALQPLEEPPFTAEAQLVCFAHALWAYQSVAAYTSNTPQNRRIRPGSLCPVTEKDVPEVRLIYRYSPVTLALVTGVVQKSVRLLNPVTNAPYYWLSVETRRGTFDVIANPSHIEGDISEGNVAQVCGSFVGRLAGTVA
jgi:hypothetical protein